MQEEKEAIASASPDPYFLVYGVTEHYDQVAEAVWSDMQSRPNYYIGGAIVGPAIGTASKIGGTIVTATTPIKIGGAAADYIHYELNPFHER